ncbi:MAG TPA: hypothetical protein VF544_02845 [Pyrinomonadaceae bacterium]|jgi:hypothetical protein
MTRRTFLTSFAFTLIILTTTAFAQLPSPATESKEEKEKAQKELERKAVALLDETLAGIQGLRLAENRSLIEAQAADLLWKRDEKRARMLFRDAMNDLAAALVNGPEKSERGMNSYWMLVQARAQTLQMIAGRDPRFALELLRSTAPPAPADNSLLGGRDQELMLEQSITAQVAADDPKLALQMAQESLNKGVSFSILTTLLRLQQKDAEAATQLGADIVKKLQSENLTAKPESIFLAMQLLRLALRPQTQQEMINARGSLENGPEAKQFKLDEQATRDLADVVIGAALRPSLHAPGILMQMQPLMPELEKLSPTRASQLQRRLAEMEKNLDPQAKSWMQFESAMQGGTPDAMLEAAAKAPAEMRGSLYQAAAWALMQKGETDRARQIITENMSGQEREQALARLDRLVIMRAIEKGKLDEVKQLISTIRSKERKASALAQLAVGVAAKGDKKSALALLDEARSLIDRQPDNDKELEALLEVARGYALVEPSRTFELLDPLIDQANEMLAAAALLEKFGAGPGLFRKGEMLLLPGMSNMGSTYTRFMKALTELSRVSFDRTRSTADRFSRDEVRLMARLIIAQSILSDRPQKNGEFDGMEGFGRGTAIIVGN